MVQIERKWHARHPKHHRTLVTFESELKVERLVDDLLGDGRFGTPDFGDTNGLAEKFASNIFNLIGRG